MKDNIFIIGGGPSLEGFNFNKLKQEDCIAINKSVKDVPWAKAFISMDYTITNKMNLSKVGASKFFVISMVGGVIKYRNYRFENVKRGKIWDLKDFDIIIKSYKQKGFSYSWNDFRNGANSGYCGIQLALLLGYTNIYLLGFDLGFSKTTHYHNGYENQKIKKFNNKMERDYNRFIIGMTQLTYDGVDIYSCSNVSRLNNIIPYRNIKEVL